MTDLVLYTRDNSQQKWIIHPTTHHVHLPPIEIMEPSVFVDVGKIRKRGELAKLAMMYPNFPTLGRLYPTLAQLSIVSPVANFPFLHKKPTQEYMKTCCCQRIQVICSLKHLQLYK